MKTIIIILLGFITLALVVLIGLAIYDAIKNNEAQNNMVGSAVVSSKHHSAAHTTYIYVNKVMVPQHHPASWSMILNKGIIAMLTAEKNPMKAKMLAKGQAEQMTVEQLSQQDLDNMRLVLKLKYDQHQVVRDVLASTGDQLIVEDCTKRQRGSGLFWGAALIDEEWKGENWLGKLWMEIRDGDVSVD